jgi:hypothetical protein
MVRDDADAGLRGLRPWPAAGLFETLRDHYGLDASAYERALALSPRRVRAWMSFPTDATRFRFA